MMTEFDKTLIKKADAMCRWHYNSILVLIDIADTEEARCRLDDIRFEKKESCQESL